MMKTSIFAYKKLNRFSFEVELDYSLNSPVRLNLVENVIRRLFLFNHTLMYYVD